MCLVSQGNPHRIPCCRPWVDLIAGIAVAALLLASQTSVALAQTGSLGADPQINFFDPVITNSPGIDREVDLTLDSIKLSGGRATTISVALEYPFLSWLEIGLEFPIGLFDPSGPGFDAGVGDIILTAQALVWDTATSQVNAGLALGLPSGSSSIAAGSTSIQPFAVGGIKLGPLDVIGDLRYTWAVAGTGSGLQIFQANLALGYPLRNLGRVLGATPFVEVNLIKPVRPVRGTDNLDAQVFVLPGIEIFLPWITSVSAGVQLPVGGARAFDYRVLMLARWLF